MKTAEAIPEVIVAPKGFLSRFDRESRLSYIALCIGLWSIIAYLLISHFVMMSVQIKGISMIPTLRDGQHYMLYRFPYLLRSPHAGEIVVIRDPQDHDLSIKRIIAVPKDVFEIRENGVYVNGNQLAEPYLSQYAAAATAHKRIEKTVLGPDDFFVMGDNRDFSADSRIYGPVPRNFILGFIHRPANRQ